MAGSTGAFRYNKDEAGGYLSIEATIAGTEESLKVIYPILSRGILPQTDSDNDGVPDTIEMANSNDPNAEEILLASASTGTAPGTTIEVPFGYRVTLGDIARRNSHHQAQLDDSLIPDRDGLPRNYNDEGVFEFNVYLPQGVNTAYVSIPLATTLNENKEYVKYTTDGWKSFITSDGNAYYSAPGSVSGGVVTCPSPVNPSSGITQWGDRENILLRGHQCVLLVIKDAQLVNDADGQLNGIIVDPGAPGTAPPRDLLAIDDSAIAETAVENDGSGQQFIGIYPAGTTATDIITEVGVTSGTFTITQIELSIIGIDADTAVVMHNNSFTRESGQTGNEFTFDSSNSNGAAIDVAENFLKSLEFGIDNDEPTGPVTLELSIRGSEGAATTETTTRTIIEENDPVEVDDRLPKGAEFQVQVSDLVGTGTFDIVTVTVNDGGDDSGITFEINPVTFNVPTAADSNVTETLTLSGNVTGEAFTLSISQSNAELAEANLITTLTFDDSRSSSVSRTITIRIVRALNFRIKVFLEGAQ